MATTWTTKSPARGGTTQKKLAGIKGWQFASKVRVVEINGQEDFNKRILNAGDRLVVIYNYCAADRELMPYITALSKELPKATFLKNNMDNSFLKELSNAPWVYLYSHQQQIESIAGEPENKNIIKEAVIKYSKDSTVVLLKKLRRLKQIQQTTKFDTLTTADLINAFKSQPSKQKLEFAQFREILLDILKSKGLAPQSTGLKVVKDGVQEIVSELWKVISAKYENADKLPSPSEQRNKEEQEAKELESILQKLISVDDKVDFEICRHLNCGVDEHKDSLSLDGLEQILAHLYKLFAISNNGSVNTEEFVTGLSIFCKEPMNEKLRHTFSFIDVNHDNTITEAELTKYLKAIHTIVLAIEPSCKKGGKLIAKLAKQIFADMDSNNNGKVSYDEFVKFVFTSKYQHLFAWMNVFQPSPTSGNGTEDDDDETFSAAGKLFVQLIETFAPPPTQPKTTKVQHTGVQCDQCNQTPIVGARYSCFDCEERDENGSVIGGYDLCEACFKKAKEAQKQGQELAHPSGHEFLELTEPDEDSEEIIGECKVM